MNKKILPQPMTDAPVQQPKLATWITMVLFGLLLIILWFFLAAIVPDSLVGAIILLGPGGLLFATLGFILFIGGLLVPLTHWIQRRIKKESRRSFWITYIILCSIFFIGLPNLWSWYATETYNRRSDTYFTQ